MLGFGALGQFALGEGPTQIRGFSGGQWQTPIRKSGLAVAVIATSFVGFVAPPQAQAAIPFTAFSQPAKPKPFLIQPWLSPEFVPQTNTAIFASFSQPLLNRGNLPDEQPSALFEVLPPVPPPFIGFSPFTDFLLSAKFRAALQPTPWLPIILPVDTHDGGWVKKKRKSKPYDAAKDELEVKYKRRLAIEEAFWPPTTYELPEYKLPPRSLLMPDVSDLTRVIMQAQAMAEQARKAKFEADDEDDLLNILKDIL